MHLTKNKLRRIKHNLSQSLKFQRSRISAISSKLLWNNPLIIYFQKPRWNEKEIEEKYKQIIHKTVSNVDLYSFKEDAPLVSIIILNNNGLSHLQRLFKNFKENIQYPHYEILVVDQASHDGSINFLKKIKEDLPLNIIQNTENKSFAQANNEAAQIAQGEYLLLLNNDVEPLYGWLNQMMKVALKSADIGVVGAKLIYPYTSKSTFNPLNSFKIQHAGIIFQAKDAFIQPYNRGNGEEPFTPKYNKEKNVAAVTAAALLVDKKKYWEVGGLDENYEYGYEDVDFCLKLLKNGYENKYVPPAVLFHYEFGTQEKTRKKLIKNMRLKNQKIFRRKWNLWLKKELFKDKLYNSRIFSIKPLKVAMAVTEYGEDASAGDYFTALELGEGLKTLGWEICFLSRRGPGSWYDVEEDVDILITFLDTYDLRKVKSNGSLIKIAWPRNWFDRWVTNPSFSQYDIVLAPSPTACNYIRKNSGIEPHLFPIATNNLRFHDQVKPQAKYSCDYCFTGSYWDDPREIMEFLEPSKLPYKFNLYGKNWEKVDKFKPYHHGFVNYRDMPPIYNSTKIVINDANRATRKYGAINSRVYDALACGVLVLSNGEIGSQETFQGKLPVFRSQDELNELITYYLENEDQRLKKAKELQEFVLKNHTYQIRANCLKEILINYLLKNRMAIKIPAPKWEEVHQWGDYHIALGLKKELEKKNWEVLLHLLPEWESDEFYDVVLVLRGLSKYQPQEKHFNIMWNISHPATIPLEEYEEYDHIFIASKYWADKINKLVDVPTEVLLQCTDPELFYPDYSQEYVHDLLFVGNSRKIFRKILKDLLPTSYDLAIYGKGWEEFIDQKYIKGEHIPNHKLRKAYSSCKILLNDHWDDMREKGFISNRLFDAFACESFIISDKVRDAKNFFGESLVTYENPEELHYLVEYFSSNEPEKKKNSKKMRNFVIENHTFKVRVDQILNMMNKNGN